MRENTKENYNINKRISQIINYLGKTRYKISQETGISEAILNNIDKNKNKASIDVVEKILNNYSAINSEWLVTGKGEMLKNDNRTSKIKEKIPENNTYNISDDIMQAAEPQMTVRRLKTDYFNLDKQLIPLYEIDAAAGLNILFSNQNTQIPLDYISVPNAPRCDGALYIRGDSMYPVLKSGDIACYKIIKEFDDVRYGEIHILDIEDSSDRYLTAKYIQKSDNGSEFLKLVSENKYHSDRDIHKSTIKAIGLVKIWIRYNTIS